ncbi:hypothetical protein EUX98_g116 [Antrodiella citrinella]|uniref:GST N-terminal domain-containing protein n=1 Tax=Antrodiella citrinella TaxID=2447956 RepID=A0A4V3XJS4_9APHY|nr:hypothetical protein EUX98_g116 [Antrodiella citrinella]
MSPVPKAALYYHKNSVWASAPLLALEEKGYGADEVDLKEVDLSTGENFAPAYLRLNPHATVPTLVVPLQNTLNSEIESRYKAIQDSKSIVEFLDKSRSSQSRTHTTSSAPAPALTPATIAYNSTSHKVIDLLHSDAADPNAFVYFNARDDAALRELSAEVLPLLNAKADALARLIQENASAEVHVSDKTMKFWEMKKLASDGILAVMQHGDTPTDQLDAEAQAKRAEYFKVANAAWGGLGDVMLQLSKEIIGPFVLGMLLHLDFIFPAEGDAFTIFTGDQLSLADLHLAAWLARIVKLAGGTASDDGDTITKKLEVHIGGAFKLPNDFSVAEARRRAGLPAGTAQPNDRQARVAAFWDAMKERSSWKKVYADGLH